MIEKIVITGATSFIGIALIDFLLKRGYHIVAIIRPNSIGKAHLNQFIGITIIECELGSLYSKEMINICSGSKYFFHIGWASNFENARYNDLGQQTNVKFTLDAIELAAESGCEAFIGIGSQAECGIVDVPISELTPDNPQNAYGRAKCETYIKGKELCEKKGIRLCWPRLLSAYGPYDRAHTLVMSCIKACRERIVIPLTPCEQMWDYIYVGDVAKALWAIAKNGEHAVKYPIASGNGQSLIRYIEVISCICNFSLLRNGIGLRAYSEQQVNYLVGDITKLSKDTGFIPKVKFEDGIRNILDVML